MFMKELETSALSSAPVDAKAKRTSAAMHERPERLMIWCISASVR